MTWTTRAGITVDDKGSPLSGRRMWMGTYPNTRALSGLPVRLVDSWRNGPMVQRPSDLSSTPCTYMLLTRLHTTASYASAMTASIWALWHPDIVCSGFFDCTCLERTPRSAKWGGVWGRAVHHRQNPSTGLESRREVWPGT